MDELILRFSARRWFSGVFFFGVVVAFEVRERNPLIVLGALWIIG